MKTGFPLDSATGKNLDHSSSKRGKWPPLETSAQLLAVPSLWAQGKVGGWTWYLPEVGAGQRLSDHLPVTMQIGGRSTKETFHCASLPSLWLASSSILSLPFPQSFAGIGTSFSGFPRRQKTNSSPTVPNQNHQDTRSHPEQLHVARSPV